MEQLSARQLLATCLSLLIMIAPTVTIVRAGGALETFDITANEPSPIPGQILARPIPRVWDARSIPVRYSMNTSQDPIPNPLGPAFLTVAAAQADLQAAFDRWNNLPTSFIEMQITGTTAKTTLAGFDLINELTFRTAANFGAIASSPSVAFVTDVTLEDGDFIDNDTDPDVSDDITVAQDVDGDGDIEFPAGAYPAGTILDNDVQFNVKPTNGLRFTVDTPADTTTSSVDLETVAVHEFGHSLGLAHTLPNQLGRSDGSPGTMFPFIDTGDPASEDAQRSLSADDIAYGSFYYPEGSAATGPAALQAGDVRFEDAYSLIEGQLSHGYLQQPIAGSNVFAIDQSEDRNTSLIGAYSGTTRMSYNPVTGGLSFLPNPAQGVVDGRYVIPVPHGNYAVGVEPVDNFDLPVAAGRINFTTQIGQFYGQQNFNEEFYNGAGEAAREDRPGDFTPILLAGGGNASGINLTTNRTLNVNNFGTRDFVGFGNVPAGFYYAVRVPASQLAEILKRGPLVIQAANFDTNVANSSVLPVFAEATLTTGTVNPDGTASINLATPLARVTNFLSQDNDFGVFYFDDPRALGQTVSAGIRSRTISNLFLLLRVPLTQPFPGISGVAPRIGLDGTNSATIANDVPIFPLSYTSSNGTSFIRDPRFNFRFSLVLSEAVP